MFPERHFLGWGRDLPGLAAEHLARDWHGGPLDLADTLVLVPTRQAARRLRERLARLAAERGTGVLPPLVLPPAGLIALALPADMPVASAADVLAAWTDAIRRLDARTAPNLFPHGRVWTRDFAGCLGVARQLDGVRQLLAANGLLVRDVPERLAAAGAACTDPARWHEFAAIETACCERLRALGLADPAEARQRAAAAPRLPPGIARVVLLGLPDPEPLCLALLGRLGAEPGLPVEVCIAAPPELATAFDAWGRPLPEAWLNRNLPLPAEAIRCVAKPGQQAAAVFAWLDCERIAPADLAVGAPDESVVPHLQRLAAGRGFGIFNPAGQPLAGHGLYHLCLDLAGLAVTGAWETAGALLRNPELLRFLAARLPEFDAAALLAAADRFQNDCLPHLWPDAFARLAHALRPEWTPLARAAATIEPLLARLREPDLDQGLAEVLGTLCAERRLAPASERDRAFASAADALADALAALDTPAVRACCGSGEERFALLQQLLAGARRYDEARETDLDVEGWLELAWNDAPRLALTGFNEGRVPEAVVAHPFLSDRSRRALDLPHNDQRFARDAYLLAALTAWRPAEHVLILFGKGSDEGDALRPSRLLFLCPDAELPARATRLFSDAPAAPPAAPHHLAWRLTPRAAPPLTALSVTHFRRYLACPYRFYLGVVLGMESVDDRKLEMDALDFGLVCHAALEQFARQPELADSDDERRIAAFLVDCAEREIERRYGRQLSAPLRIQLDSIRQRLTHAARVQAAHRRDGWRILEAERRLGSAGVGFEIDGMPVHGRLDRIDQHADGRLLVLDFKTSDQPQHPETTHLAPCADTHPAPDFARVDAGGRPSRWLDLQLPLYCLALLRDGHGPVLAGYVNLPKAVTASGVSLWPIDNNLLESAEGCARGVVRAVREGRFWPPAEALPYDDFADLFRGPVAEAAAPPPPPAAREATPP
jgi:ATP-dependent helicase/nuclease subunit B